MSGPDRDRSVASGDRVFGAGEPSGSSLNAGKDPIRSEASVAADGVSEDIDEILELCLEALATMGPVATAAELRQLLPDARHELRRYVLLELIKLDMALHAELGRLPSLDNYLEAFVDLITHSQVPVDLVMEEIQLRKELQVDPCPEEYQSRFPHLNSIIAHLVRGGEATAAIGQLRKPPELPVGREVDDFVIVRKIGEGAFAHVFLARQVSMHRLVALKVSMGRGDEPQALAQFDHPNIVRVFDQRTVVEPPLHLLYMQYHPGGTLADVVAMVRTDGAKGLDGRLLLQTIDRSLLQAAQAVPDRSSVRQWIQAAEWPMVVAWLGVQLSHALQDAHDLGVMHRDVKPANVLLTSEGIPKLADFNVSFAGAAGRAGAAATFGGSIGYMAPEHLQAISARVTESPVDVGPRADLYSLAILLWELWQGHRPFPVDISPTSWTDAVAQQLESRSGLLSEPKRNGTASERVLEKSLRSALEYDILRRPSEAAEMAGRLKLALHPEAAGLLDPSGNTWRNSIAKRSPWIVAGAVILLPNITAGLLNYQYNSTEIKMTPTMRETLAHLATWVNVIVYPIGVLLMVLYTKGLVNAIKSTRAGRRVTPEELDDTLALGHRAAVIGGTCWIAAGIVYTAILASMYDEFTSIQATHFFISMLICGGVAMVYPMFGMALLATFVYYPLLVRGSMKDERFEIHRAQMTRRCEAYLLIASLIPLLGAALLISSESSARRFMLTAIAAGLLGSFASFFAYRLIVHTWDRLAEVLSTKKSVIPGEAN